MEVGGSRQEEVIGMGCGRKDRRLAEGTLLVRARSLTHGIDARRDVVPTLYHYIPSRRSPVYLVCFSLESSLKFRAGEEDARAVGTAVVGCSVLIGLTGTSSSDGRLLGPRRNMYS